MKIANQKYREFHIDVDATPSSFAGLWIGNYDISRRTYGIAAASFSGPNKTEEEAISNAFSTAKAFIDDDRGQNLISL